MAISQSLKENIEKLSQLVTTDELTEPFALALALQYLSQLTLAEVARNSLHSSFVKYQPKN